MYNDTEHSLLSEILDEIEEKHGKLTGRASRDFITRLSTNFSVLRDLFMSLYDQRKDREKRFRQLIVSLYSKSRRRPKSLRLQDRAKEGDHQWLLDQQWVGMSMYLEHFAKDLSGFQKRLGYLDELGINLVHIISGSESPPIVSPEFGKMSDLDALAKKLRKKDMLLTLDLALNQTTQHHKWAKKALKGNKKYQDYYYMFNDRLIPDQYEVHMPEMLPASSPGNFTFQKELNKWVMTVFHKHQWDLNYRNPRVLIEMVGVLLYLANQGVDILRIDAPAFLWKKMGTICQNLQQAHTLLKLMKRCIEVVAPGVKFIVETIVAPDDVIKYLGAHEKDHECDVAYQNTLMALIWESLATTKVELFKKSIGKLPVKPMGTTWINYVRRHHDIDFGFEDEDIYQIGFDAKLHRAFLLEYYTGKFRGSFASGAQSMLNATNNDIRISGTLASLAGLEKSLEQHKSEQIENSIRKIVMAHAIIMSFGGLPIIYSGDEIGQLNDYGYKNDPARSKDSRWMHRPAMDWKSAKKRSDQGTIQHSIFTALQKLILIRKNSPEWADFNSCKLAICENQHILAYLRSQNHVGEAADQGRQTLVLANFHPSVQFLKSDILSRYGFDINRDVVDKYTEQAPTYHKDLLQFQPFQFYFITEKVNL